MDRREFIKLTSMAGIGVALNSCSSIKKQNPPNIILVMSDDQGWGDVAYNGNPIVKTPHLDSMAQEAIRFDRFYSAAPVCSPTRGSCITGRHPYRYGIPWANAGSLPEEEITLAEVLKSKGYNTGHFGKWHLGQVSRTLVEEDGIKPLSPEKYSPPWENGFDTCFSTESRMPTYNPYYINHQINLMDIPVKYGDTSGKRWQASYWTGPGQIVDENLAGDDSQIIMDHALEFINTSIKSKKHFFSCIWFHAPHSPIVAGDDTRALYPDLPIQQQHWFGCLTALDKQIGRLRNFLRDKKIHENTIIWFCSDNGPSYIHDYNSAGPFRGEKGTLWEGGIRVPALFEWPAKFKQPKIITAPVSTSDFFPTLLSACGIQKPNELLLDGIDVMPIIKGNIEQRPTPIAFQAPIKNRRDPWARKGSKQMALSDNRYKLLTFDKGNSYQLYDLLKDPSESKDLSSTFPDIVDKMKNELNHWVQSCRQDEKRYQKN